MKNCENVFIDVQNAKYILSDTYFSPYSSKIETETESTKKVTKKEEPLNLNLAELNEGKSLAFPVSLC